MGDLADYYQWFRDNPRDDLEPWLWGEDDADEQAMRDELRRTGMIQGHATDTGTPPETVLLARALVQAGREREYERRRLEREQERKERRPWVGLAGIAIRSGHLGD